MKVKGKCQKVEVSVIRSRSRLMSRSRPMSRLRLGFKDIF